jgi:hypothetical protein
MTAMLVIALAQHWTSAAGGSGEGTTNEVLIGVLPSQELSDQQEEAISTGDVQSSSVGLETEMSEELSTVEPTTNSSSDAVGGGTNVGIPSPSSGGGGGFDLGPVNIGGSMAGGGGDGKTWGGMIQQLRRHGLDIVICFDSTGSMTGEIDQVKRQIERIGSTLVTLVPKARISIVTYKDRGDEFVVKGMPLTGNIADVKSYLSRIEAGGGGDQPEAVDEGLRWSSQQNQFRPAARKVILIFGDAPPHEEYLKKCLELAAGFKGQQKGIVSTVTCRSSAPLPEFYEIARAGGGEAFLTSNQREIMTQLMVLVFGSRHREKVLEAFKLLDE